MTTVARQIPTARESLHSAAVPAPVTMVSQQPGGVKAFVASHNSKAEFGQRKGASTTGRTIASVSNGSSPPPPPPARTSSRTTKIPYKEDVVLCDKPQSSYSPSRTGRSVSIDRMERESSVERGKLSSASDGMTGDEGRDYYTRQRSHTETSPARPRGKSHFNTIQWRGDVKFNPYTGATAQSIHGKMSMSHPHLNKMGLESLVAPNDRIKKSMFEHELGNEEEEGMGEDYGSGYRPTLMKISHGDVQKHTVAVTTPTVPSMMNRFGSDPNMLESQLDKAGMTRVKTNASGVPNEGGVKSISSRREERHSVGEPPVADSRMLTTPIARAYREHLIDKMENKKKRKQLGSSGSSSASPSPSISSAESSTVAQSQSSGDNLSAKLRSITPSQLQGIDVPDRAYYPKILPPPNPSADKKQDQLAGTVHNEGYPHNPFLSYSSPPMTGYDVPDTASYDVLPRKKTDMNQVQRVNMGLNGQTQSINEHHSPPMSQTRALHQQKKEWNRPNDPTRSLSSAEQTVSRPPASMSAYQAHSNKPQAVPSSGEAGYWRNGASVNRYHSESMSSSGSPQHSSKSGAATTSMGSQKHGGSINDTVSRNETSHKPPVLPKPAVSKRNGSSLTPPPANHERSTSDPSLNYSSAQFRNHRSSASTSPAVPRLNSGADFDSRQQYSRAKQRLQGQQISTSLLEIREADEGEEREKKTVRRSGVTFTDYVSLNSSLFPKRIRLRQDFCTGSKDVIMSQGEEFDLHFIHSVKSVLMTDSSGVNYTAPLTSIAKFSLIYDPFGAEKVAMQGFHFKTAGVLMDLRNPPNAVAATQACDGGQAESSVEQGEVLVLQGVKNVFHGRLLKAFSLKHRITKYLDEKCYGNFSTTPDKIRMSLTQMYETSIPLPQKAQFHSTSSILDSVHAALQSDSVVLKQFAMAQSVIATALSSSSEVVSAVRLPCLSLSLDLDIDVREVSTPETHAVQMRKKTQSLLENFGKVPLIPYVDMPTTASYVAQCALLLNLDPKLESITSEILTPESVMSPKRHDKTADVRTTSASTQISGPKDADAKRDSRIKALEDKYSVLESKVQEACSTLEKVSLKVDQVHSYLSKAQNAMTKHKKQLQESERKNLQKNSSSTSIRPHSSFAGDVTNSVVSACNSTASTSRESSFSRPSSRLSLKLSSESESVDGGFDRRSLNDDVFVARSNSASKPPTLPKPKELVLKRPKKADANSHVAEAKRRLSLGETNRQAPDGICHVVVEAKAKLSAQGNSRPPIDSNPRVTEAKRRFSFGESNRQPTNISPRPFQAKTKLSSGENNPQARQAAESKQNDVHADSKPAPLPATNTLGDSVDLKDYLLDSSHKYNPVDGASSMITPTKATPTSTKEEPAEMDFTSIEALTNDLTDWCTQVEDELTQLYNDSILSVSS